LSGRFQGDSRRRSMFCPSLWTNEADAKK